MSFCETNTFINEGDTAIVYLSFNQLYPIQVKRGLSHHTKYGSLKHDDLIGKKYGSKFECTKGTCYVLQGDPALWTISLPHRTQILYTPTNSVIALQLELKPGSIVVESGTGSASLSHSLIRTVYPSGHLHTFEFHLQRSEAARKEFKDHGMSPYVTVYNRDVCSDGFGLEDVADAVFLDLPSPWKALASAKKAIKREGGRICSFSPCIEQVQKSVIEMTELGFTDICTIESLRRVLCVKKYAISNFDFDIDIRNAKKREDFFKKKEEEANGSKQQQQSGEEVSKKNFKNNKKPKLVKNEESNDEEDDEDSEVDEQDKTQTITYTAKPINQQPGHTGFLTFATLLHKGLQKM